jgi:hypothetical protein
MYKLARDDLPSYPAIWSLTSIDELGLGEYWTMDYPIVVMVVVPELDPYLESLTITSALSLTAVIIRLHLQANTRLPWSLQSKEQFSPICG